MEETKEQVTETQAPSVQEAAPQAPETPDAPVVETPTAETTTAQPEVPTTPAEPVAAPEAPKAPEVQQPKAQPKMKIKVETAKPKKVGGFKPGDVTARKAWMAERHSENQKILLKAGYTTSTVVDIMRYLTTSRPYEEKGGKDHLILMFDRMARSLKYRMNFFDKNLSSQIAIVFIDLHDRLNKTDDLFNLPAKESMTFVRKQIKSAWKSNIGEDYSHELVQAVENCFNMTMPEGYAKRAMYFIECVSDILLRLSDPFEGLFHTEPIEMPEELKRKKKYVFPPKMCPKCGKEMKWVFPLKKHVCMNPVCEDYRPPRPKELCSKCGKPMKWIPPLQKCICVNKECEDYRPPRKKRQDGGYHNPHDDGRNESATDKFQRRYGKGKVNPASDKPVVSIAPTEVKDAGDGTKLFIKKEFRSNSFDVLDKLKVEQK